MFYAEKSSHDFFASKIMGDEYLCFHYTHLSGRLPFFLVEIPCKVEDDDTDYTVSKPMLVSGINELQMLCLVQEKTIAELKVSIIFHGFMTDEFDWQCQRVTEILRGRWKLKKQWLETVRICLDNEKSVYLNGVKPNESTSVAWERFL